MQWGRASMCATASEELVHGHDVGRARIDSDLRQDRHQSFAELVERRLRLPDVVHHEGVVGTEARVVETALRFSRSRIIEQLHDLVVLRGTHRRGVKVDSNGHGGLLVRGRGLSVRADSRPENRAAYAAIAAAACRPITLAGTPP